MRQRHRNTPVFLPEDQLAYLRYYQAQAGAGGIPVFRGSQAQYGYGLGGILRGLIRRIIPFGARVIKAVKPMALQAFEIAKPHLRDAATDIAHAGLQHINNKISNMIGASKQPETNLQSGTGLHHRKRKKTVRSKFQQNVKKRRLLKAKRSLTDIYSRGF